MDDCIHDMNLEEGDHAVLSVATACGYYKITKVHGTTAPLPIDNETIIPEQPQTLSRKEARKRKKLLRKQACPRD